MTSIIISIILNLLLGAPADTQTTTTTTSSTEEQALDSMGGGSAWVNNDKIGG